MKTWSYMKEKESDLNQTKSILFSNGTGKIFLVGHVLDRI